MAEEEKRETESTAADEATTLEAGETTATASSEESTLDVRVEDSGPCEKTISITADPDALRDRYQQSLDELCGTVQLPGFRPGKAPRGMVEKRLAPTIRSQIKSQVLREGIEQGLEGLNTVGDPILPDVESMDIDLDQEFVVTVKVEVLPEVTVNNYKGLEARCAEVEITEDDVEREIKQLLRRHGGRLVDLPNGHMEMENYGEGDVELREGENMVWSDEKQPLHMAREMIGPVSVPGMAEAVIGMKAGDEQTLSTTLNENFPVPDLVGKTVDVKIKLTGIRKLQEPPLTDETAKKLGYESVDQMKARARQQMELRRDSIAADIVRNQLASKLLEENDIDLPPRMIQQETEENVRRTQVNLLRQGYTMKDVTQLSDQISEHSRESVVRSLKTALLLKAIADEEKIFVTEDEIDAYVKDLAHREQMSDINMRRALEKGNLIRTIRSRLREEKVYDFLLKAANVVTKQAPKEPEEGSAEESEESNS